MLKKFENWNKNRPALFTADFETFREESTYYKRNGFSGIYCISVKRVEVAYNPSTKYYNSVDVTKDRHLDRSYKPFIFVKVNNWLDFHRSYKINNQVIYFHNFIKFDRHYLNAWLIDNKIMPLNNETFNKVVGNWKDNIDEPCDVWCFEYSGSKFALIKIGLWNEKEKLYKILEFRDSRMLFKLSVKKMGERLPDLQKINDSINLYKKVTDFTGLEINEPLNSVEELKEKYNVVYNRVLYDSLITAEYLKFYFTNPVFINKGSNLKFSVPSLAVNHLISLLIDEGNNKKDLLLNYFELQNVEKINNYFLLKNNYYYGGITSYIPKYQNCWIDKKIISYDINSMYPTQMVKNLPYGEPVSIKSKITKKEKENYFIFVEIEGTFIKQLNERIPALLNKRWLQTGEELDSQSHYFYNLSGFINFCVTLDEAELFLNPNTFQSDLKIKKYILFKQKTSLKSYIEKYYQFKANATNKIDKDLAKLFLNSLYGKFGERPIHEVDIPRIIYNSKLVEDKKDFTYNAGTLDKKSDKIINYYVKGKDIKWSTHTYAPIACAITSLARAFLITSFINFSEKDKDLEIYYCDTDSMKVNKELSGNLIDAKKLGLWKDEGHFNHLKIIRPKVYVCCKNKEDWMSGDLFACSGLDNSALMKTYKPNEINEDTYILTTLTSFDQKHQPIIHDNKLKYINKLK